MTLSEWRSSLRFGRDSQIERLHGLLLSNAVETGQIQLAFVRRCAGYWSCGFFMLAIQHICGVIHANGIAGLNNSSTKITSRHMPDLQWVVDEKCPGYEL